MTIIVTGAGGLTGGAITRRLIERGEHVVAVSRRDPGFSGATTVIGDVGDPAVLGSHLRDSRAVVHVAGILEGIRLARVSGLAAVPRLVVISSAGVYSRHRVSANAYLAGEQALAAAHPRAVFVRPTMIYGSSRDRNIHHVIRFADRFGVLPQLGDGKAHLQPIHFEDLAMATVALLPSDRTGTIDAGGGAPVALRVLLREVFAALGRPARVVRLPMAPFLLAGRLVDRASGRRVSERIERMSEERTVDNAELVAATGIEPRALQQGIRDQVALMRAEGAIP